MPQKGIDYTRIVNIAEGDVLDVGFGKWRGKWRGGCCIHGIQLQVVESRQADDYRPGVRWNVVH